MATNSKNGGAPTKEGKRLAQKDYLVVSNYDSVLLSAWPLTQTLSVVGVRSILNDMRRKRYETKSVSDAGVTHWKVVQNKRVLSERLDDESSYGWCKRTVGLVRVVASRTFVSLRWSTFMVLLGDGIGQKMARWCTDEWNEKGFLTPTQCCVSIAILDAFGMAEFVPIKIHSRTGG